ncbi:MAG: hypothetical protein FJ130_13160 [Deltaproteobacteria bacterium]|nr:hypothetical protein [Deltaproteobacteria bacterium]
MTPTSPKGLGPLLIQNRKPILERWLHLILETYPVDTAPLLKKEKDPFLNPVRSTIAREIEILFEELLHDMNGERLSTSLSSILKIRSVQDFPPSEAAGIALLLKKAVQEILETDPQKETDYEEWARFHVKVDALALRAFDIYMECREKICEIKVNKALAEKEMAFKMLERVGFRKEKSHRGKDSDG